MNRTYITNLHSLEDWFFARDCSKLAFDTETDGLDPCVLKCLGMSFCDGEDVCYIDLDVGEREKMISFLSWIFRERIKRLVAHHISFDLMVIWTMGIREHTENIFCTQVASHLLDERQTTSLKDLVVRYLGVPYSKIKKWEDVKEDHHSEIFYIYGCNDAEWCWDLHEIFYKDMSREGFHHLFFKIEMPFMLCLRDLSLNGIEVDVKALQAIEDKVYPIQMETEDQLLEMIGKEAHIEEGFWKDCDMRKSPINFNSNKQVIPILLDQFGVKLTELTKTGEKLKRDKKPVGDDYYKLDGVVMRSLYHECEFVRILHKHRMAKDLKDKFTMPLKEAISPDGRCRTSFNDCMAATGRLSSSDPNLQNLRKLNKVLKVECREVFVAPRGKAFIVGDFAGQELRLLGEETQDVTLLDAFRAGKDLHLVTANLLFDLGLIDLQMIEGSEDYEEAKVRYKDERHKGKNGFNFPVIFGSTEIGIARNIGIPVKEAKRLLEKFLNEYPGIDDSIAACTKLVKYQGWVRHMFGRKRRFDQPSNRAFRQAFNFKIQGAAADMLRMAMIKVRAVILQHPEWELLMVLTVHDELVLEVKKRYVKKAMAAVKEAMESAVSLSVPIICDMSSGQRYSDAK